MVSIFYFKSENGAIEGEFALIPEYTDINDAGYDALIPIDSIAYTKSLSLEQSENLLLNGILHNKAMY